MNARKHGFSLIELVVAMTMGGIILVSVMGSFLTLSKMKHQLDLTRQIQREINFATTRVADRIRSQSVDYHFLNFDPDINHHFLPIIGADTFEFDDTPGELKMNGEPLFSSNLMVQDVVFTVSQNPEISHLQPSVTIEMEVSERSDDPKIIIPIRTTISSRIIQ